MGHLSIRFLLLAMLLKLPGVHRPAALTRLVYLFPFHACANLFVVHRLVSEEAEDWTLSDSDVHFQTCSPSTILELH